MRFRYAAVISLLMIALCSQMQGAAKLPKVIASWRGDLDNDETIEIVEITCASIRNGHPMGGDIIVRRTRQAQLVWRHTKLNPWKLQVVDVDGDGKKDVVVGVWKKSPKDPVMAKRAFVYSWNGSRLVPKWLGSRLSRRFDDFALADVDRDGFAELFSFEMLPNGKHRISEYRWRSFGFDWLGCTAEVEGITGLRAGSGGIEIIKTVGKTAAFDLTRIQYWRRNGNEDS